MDLGLRDRVILVVGASSGIGEATARCLAAEGAKLVLVARRKPELQRVAQCIIDSGGAMPLLIDIDASLAGAADQVIARTIEHHGALHGLVVVAGAMGERAPAHALSDDACQAYFDAHFMLAMRACRAAIPQLSLHVNSAIVLTSAYSIRAQKPELLAYTAMKAAVASLAKNLAKTYGDKGLRVNAIAPGIIDVDAPSQQRLSQLHGVPPEQARYESVRQRFGMSVALARAGQPQEFADVIAFLLSARASYVSGAVVNIDGGTDF